MAGIPTKALGCTTFLAFNQLDALDVAIYPKLCLLSISIVDYIGLVARVCATV